MMKIANSKPDYIAKLECSGYGIPKKTREPLLLNTLAMLVSVAAFSLLIITLSITA